MELESALSQIYQRNYVPVECQDNDPTKQLLKMYETMFQTSKHEINDFVTTDPVILRNTAINSFIGQENVTEEQIHEAMRKHQITQKEFYYNWKVQQSLSYIKGEE